MSTCEQRWLTLKMMCWGMVLQIWSRLSKQHHSSVSSDKTSRHTRETNASRESTKLGHRKHHLKILRCIILYHSILSPSYQSILTVLTSTVSLLNIQFQHSVSYNLSLELFIPLPPHPWPSTCHFPCAVCTTLSPMSFLSHERSTVKKTPDNSNAWSATLSQCHCSLLGWQMPPYSSLFSTKKNIEYENKPHAPVK